MLSVRRGGGAAKLKKTRLVVGRGPQQGGSIAKPALLGAALRLHYTRLFPNPRFCFLCSKILPVTKMRLNVCFNEMALFGPFAAMAEMEVSPQEKMANPQGMRVFAVERPGLPEDFVSFPALCGVQSSPLVFAPNLPFVRGPLQW